MHEKNETIEKALLLARLERPYFSRILTAMRCVEEEKAGTIAVDRSLRVYYSRKWLDAQDDEHLAGIICHEIQHVLRAHHARVEARDAKKWNIAADAEINDDLCMPLPADCVTPEKIGCDNDLCAEQYYTQIKDNDQQTPCGGGSGAGAEKEWELGADISPAVIEKIIEKVAQDIIAHSASAAGVGNKKDIMWANERLERLKEKINWKSKLRSAIARKSRERTQGRDDASFKKIGRRNAAGKDRCILPGRTSPRLFVDCIIDTSGSMGGLGSQVLSVIDSLRRSGHDIMFYDCDTIVNAKRRIRNLKAAKFFGGGGTDLAAALDACKGDAIVVITDGELEWPKKMPAQKTIIVTIGDNICVA